MRRVVLLLLSGLLLAGCGGGGEDRTPAAAAPDPLASDVSETAAPVVTSSHTGHGGSGVLHGTYTRLDGDRTDLASFKGKVVLVVNTASHCGNTPQYAQLEALYRERRADGLTILGFPANDFAQETGSNEEIAAFCKKNFGVSFPMFAKSVVTGDGATPLFRALADAKGEPEWNFAKYLVDREGRVVARFPASMSPDDPELVSAVGKLL